jgi:hypothetical protein
LWLVDIAAGAQLGAAVELVNSAALWQDRGMVCSPNASSAVEATTVDSDRIHNTTSTDTNTDTSTDTSRNTGATAGGNNKTGPFATGINQHVSSSHSTPRPSPPSPTDVPSTHGTTGSGTTGRGTTAAGCADGRTCVRGECRAFGQLSSDPADYELEFMLLNAEAVGPGHDPDGAPNIARLGLSVRAFSAEIMRD